VALSGKPGQRPSKTQKRPEKGMLQMGDAAFVVARRELVLLLPFLLSTSMFFSVLLNNRYNGVITL